MALIHDTKTINGSQWDLKKKKKKKNPNPDFVHCLLHHQAHSELRHRSAPRSSHGLSTSCFQRSLSPGTNFFSLRWKMYCWVCLHLLIVCVCLCVCIISRPIKSPGTNQSQHLSNPDQADLSLFISENHHTWSQPLWLWFSLGVDKLGALLDFYSLNGLVREWFRWCCSGWFDLVAVLS